MTVFTQSINFLITYHRNILYKDEQKGNNKTAFLFSPIMETIKARAHKYSNLEST